MNKKIFFFLLFISCASSTSSVEIDTYNLLVYDILVYNIDIVYNISNAIFNYFN